MPGQIQDSALASIPRPRESAFAIGLRRILRKPSSRVALVILGTIVLVGLLAPFIAPYDPAAQPDIVALKEPRSFPRPSVRNGSVQPRRAEPGDLWRAIVAGDRTSGDAGQPHAWRGVRGDRGIRGGVVDAVMMRVLDAFLAIPRLLLLLGILVAWPQLSIGALVLFLGLTGWFGLSRIVRGQVLALKHAEFVTAAHALGASRRRILVRHLLPNLISPIVVAATVGVAHVIVLEAGLSYLGIGVPQPLASWGNIIQDGADQVATLWWMSLFPGLFMVLTVMTLNILGEALRDAYDRR